jgi:hypothetical protein
MTNAQNIHKEILPHKPLVVDLLEDLPMYYKIDCKSQSTPATIRFVYRDVNSSMTAIVSRTNKKPDALKHD